MTKLGLLFAMAACCLSAVLADTCSRDASAVFTGIDFVDMKDECVTATEEQIKKEITASLKYLSMGAFFSKDNINRPGFAKLFFEAASEEREHAYKLIEYLSMRGRYLRQKDNQWKSKILNFDISQLVKDSEKLSVMNMNLVELTPLANEKTTSGLIALQNALKLETAVTKSIRALIQSCEGDEFNHYHFVDYLTGEFLEEQYKGQRDLAGKISTLGKMVQNQGAELADFLFDKQLL